MSAASSAGDRLGAIREAGRNQLWPVPVLGVLLALLAGVLVPLLDMAVDDDLPPAVADLLFGGGAGAARTVLDAIASSLITVTSLTFSLTVVTLQLASSQFSPRLLRTFTRDRFVHVTLAVFLGTFTYALTVLRGVRSAEEGGAPVVPQISVTLAFLLAIASVVCLVLFLAHLAREIRVETMLETVHRDARATADRLHPPGASLADDARRRAGQLHEAPVDAAVVVASRSGFLARVDQGPLVEAATRLGLTVAVLRRPGSSVVAGTPLARVWLTALRSAASGAGDLPPDALAEIDAVVAAEVVIGPERTESQDVSFGLRQLTDVTNKALSPGINDPTTAVHALGHTAAFLCEVAGRGLGDVTCRDADDVVRLVLARPDLPALMEIALTQPRRYGAADPVVVDRLVTLLGELAWCVDGPEDRAAVLDQLARVRVTVDAQAFDATELRQLQAAMSEVESTLAARAAGRAPRSPQVQA